MTHTVIGLFDNRADAEAAMAELTAQGFGQGDIDISNRRFDEAATGDEGYNNATSGGGGTTGTSEGFGDKVSNFFSSLFGDDEPAARNYTNAASEAEAILTIQVDSEERARLAQDIMDRHDAIDIDERGSSSSGGSYGQQNYTGSNAGATGSGYTETENSGDVNARSTIPVVEENLNVDKQEVERGGARIRSRIIERPVKENIRLREEHVVVNRRPVDREVTDADLQNFRPGEMEITERAEVPIVGKQARVVEEIEVGKEVTERDETIRETVRGTDVDVEQFNSDADNATGTRARRARP